MLMSTPTIRAVSPVLGAEVFDVDLAAGIDDATFAIVHQAFLNHGVLFFRDQAPLTAERQTEFARRLGPLHTHPAAPADDDESAIFVIHAHKDSPVANGNGWHTDVSCDAAPPMATMLQIKMLPTGGGGDTLFTSTEAAYAALDDSWRDRLRGLQARHESEHVYRGRYADRGVDDSDAVYPESIHPVVRTHPETGRPGIYVNRSFTTEIIGLEPDESRRLLQRLFAHIERPEFQIRLRWNENDVALWDNRSLQHFAVWDYWPNERKGTRVSIGGDVPIFDADKPDAPRSTVRLSTGSLAPLPS